MADVAIFLGAGTAQVGGQSFVVAPGAAGAVRLADGPELRPLSFGERGALTRAALAAPVPARELSQGILAVSRSGDAAHPAAAALALHLAGAGSTEVGFAAAQSLLARHLGWSAEDVTNAPAAEVDALAAEWQTSLLAGPSGWTRIVFEAPGAGDSDDPDDVALSLAENLLQRARAGLDPEVLPAVSGAPQGAGPSTGVSGQVPARAAYPAMPDPAIAPDPTGAGDGDAAMMARTTPFAGDAPTPQDQAPSPDVTDEPRAVAPLPGQQPPAAQGGQAPRGQADATGPRAAWPVQDPVPPAPDLRQQPGHPSDGLRAPAASDTRAPVPTPDIWARRPVSAARLSQAQGGTPVPASGPAMHAFAGWFDEALAEADRNEPDRPEAAPWVWAGRAPRDVPVPDLPETRTLASAADPTEALAEALHLAADLRGIAR